MAAAVLWGLIGPFSVWAAREGLTATQVAFWRTALACLPFALWAGRRLRLPPRELVGLAAFGVFGIATMYVSFFIAVQRTGVGIAAVLLYTGPAWVAIYEWVVASRAPARATIMALLITIVGVVLLSIVPERLGAVDRLGILAALIAGLSYSTHYTVGRRFMARHGAATVLAVAMLAAAIVIAPIARPTWPAADAWPPLLFLAVIATFVASLLFGKGVVQVAPVRGAITATIEPVVAVIASILVLDARLHAQQLVGALLVLVGVTMILMQGSERETATPSIVS